MTADQGCVRLYSCTGQSPRAWPAVDVRRLDLYRQRRWRQMQECGAIQVRITYTFYFILTTTFCRHLRFSLRRRNVTRALNATKRCTPWKRSLPVLRRTTNGVSGVLTVTTFSGRLLALRRDASRVRTATNPPPLKFGAEVINCIWRLWKSTFHVTW